MNNKSLLCITSYPQKEEGHSQQTVGGASYTKELLTVLSKNNPDTKMKVFADILVNKESYFENNISVIRSWKRKNLISILRLCWDILMSQEKSILISFEGYLFGSLIYSLPIFVTLFIKRVFGTRTLTLLHQVPNSFKYISGNKLMGTILKVLSQIFFLVIQLSSTSTIVFEEEFRNRLPIKNNIFVIPHMIFDIHFPSKNSARTSLNINKDSKIALVFGYLAPYKGIDTLISAWPRKSKVKLIVAGGINPNHKNNLQIKRFVEEIKEKAQGKNIKFVGFLPEDNISKYFSATDYVVLPYKTFMSSSGPLAFALAAKKQIMFSKELSGYAKTRDFSNALKKANLNPYDLFINISEEDLSENLSKNYTNQFELFGSVLSESRNPAAIAKQFSSLIFS